jgi:hypothetical protein
MTRLRSRNLGPKEIDLVVGILDGWADALSWNHLIDAIELRLLSRYTRQALSNHERICEAFRLAKTRLLEGRRAGAARKPKTPEEQALSARLARRDAEVIRLRAENQRLMERHVVWLYNAQVRGISEVDLDRPLPPVYRGQTKIELRVSNGS